MFYPWMNFDYFHSENLPKHPDPKILEAWEKEWEERSRSKEEDEA